MFLVHNKRIQDHSRWTAAGGLLLVCLHLPLPPSSHSQQKLSGTLAGLLMVWGGFGAEYDSKGVKGDTLGGPMTSLLRWPMFKLEDRSLEFHPSPPQRGTECTRTSGSMFKKYLKKIAHSQKLDFNQAAAIPSETIL